MYYVIVLWYRIYVFLQDRFQLSNHTILTSLPGERIICSTTSDTEKEWSKGKMCHRYLMLNPWLGPDYFTALAQGPLLTSFPPYFIHKIEITHFIELLRRLNNIILVLTIVLVCDKNCFIIFHIEWFFKLVTMTLPSFTSFLRIFSKEGKLQKEFLPNPLPSWNLLSYVPFILLGLSSIPAHNSK